MLKINRIYIRIYIYIYILWRVGCLPLIISISPSLNRRPSPGSRREWVCERRGRWNSQVWRRVMRHTWSEWSIITAAVICRVRLSSRRSLPRACTLVSSWVQEGSVEGASAAPVTRLTGQDAGPYSPRRCRGPKEDEAARRSRRPSRSGPGEGSACGRRTPPLTWTLPSRTLPLLHNPRSTTRTPDPLFILDTSSPLDTLFYYFCSIEASPRPDATPTVSVVCSSRHNIYIYIYLWQMLTQF